MRLLFVTVTLVSTLLASLISGVSSRVDGPFALYTTSSDPAWNMRVINIGAKNAFMAVPPGSICSPSQIPYYSINFYINTTSTQTPDAPSGHLTWGAQPSFQKLTNRIKIVDVNSGIQPFFFDIDYQLQGYTTYFNFTTEAGNRKQLQLANSKGKFYGKYLQTLRYNYDTIHWIFGSDKKQAGPGAVEVAIWRYDPPKLTFT
ncbi:hypothetical protein FRC19_007611 [Serendipita sp. 401]|nr:hypothetical protein FRC19_007611 [Serendipita sp. 401]KAG9057628.1 hypothetical protein FS842_005332 [Serendipita sp. 407]